MSILAAVKVISESDKQEDDETGKGDAGPEPRRIHTGGVSGKDKLAIKPAYGRFQHIAFFVWAVWVADVGNARGAVLNMVSDAYKLHFSCPHVSEQTALE